MNVRLLPLALLAVVLSFNIDAQIIVDSKAEVRNIDFSLAGDELVITYDLVNTKSAERYTINVDIFTMAGKQIDASTFEGDVGEGVPGGYNKTIRWQMAEDIAYLDDQIYVVVRAVHENPRIIQPTGKGKAILLSTVFPGWGSAKTTLNGARLLKGVAAYGCIAGYFYFNGQSDKSYTDYLNATTATGRNDFFTQSEKEYQNAQYMLVAAGAVWLWDYITVLAAPNRSQKKGFRSQVTYLGPGFTGQQIPCFSLVLNF